MFRRHIIGSSMRVSILMHLSSSQQHTSRSLKIRPCLTQSNRFRRSSIYNQMNCLSLQCLSTFLQNIACKIPHCQPLRRSNIGPRHRGCSWRCRQPLRQSNTFRQGNPNRRWLGPVLSWSNRSRPSSRSTEWSLRRKSRCRAGTIRSRRGLCIRHQRTPPWPLPLEAARAWSRPMLCRTSRDISYLALMLAIWPGREKLWPRLKKCSKPADHWENSD